MNMHIRLAYKSNEVGLAVFLLAAFSDYTRNDITLHAFYGQMRVARETKMLCLIIRN